MKIYWKSELDGRSGISVDPEGYDGTPPLRELWLDRAPNALNADRVAIASALVFGSYVASGLEFERPVSVGVAEAIKAFCDNEGLNVAPIEYQQRPFAFGDGVLMIEQRGPEGISERHSASQRRVQLNVLRSDVYSGSLMSTNSLSVSSNAYLHDGLSSALGNSAFAVMAVGILFAEDLGLDTCTFGSSPLPLAVTELLVAAGLRTE